MGVTVGPTFENIQMMHAVSTTSSCCIKIVSMVYTKLYIGTPIEYSCIIGGFTIPVADPGISGGGGWQVRIARGHKGISGHSPHWGTCVVRSGGRPLKLTTFLHLKDNFNNEKLNPFKYYLWNK